MPSDQLRQDALWWITYHSNRLRASSQSVVDYVSWLDHQPEYETQAEAAMKEAEAALWEAKANRRRPRQPSVLSRWWHDSYNRRQQAA